MKSISEGRQKSTTCQESQNESNMQQSNHGRVQERHAYKDRNTKARSSVWLCAALSDLERRSARAEEGALNTVGTFVLLLPLCWRVTHSPSQEGDAKDTAPIFHGFSVGLSQPRDRRPGRGKLTSP